MDYKKTYCNICCYSYRNCNFKKHKCNKKENAFKILNEWKTIDDLYKCPKCEFTFSKMGLVGHYYRKHDERGIEFLNNRKQNSRKHNKKRLTKEEKSKIYSDSMKLSYRNGISKGWNFINGDKNRRSYPEKFFIEVFKNNNLYEKFTIEEKFNYGKYFIDFLFIELKLIVEIDGSQHYRTKKAIEHDRIRDCYFINEGFKIYRIKWIDVMNKTKSEIGEFLNFIKNIQNKTIRKYTIDDCSYHLKNDNCKCGNKKLTISSTCITCKGIKSRKIKDRPSYDQIIIDIEELGYSGTGRKYGVSDNCIRKWIKK